MALDLLLEVLKLVKVMLTLVNTKVSILQPLKKELQNVNLIYPKIFYHTLFLTPVYWVIIILFQINELFPLW